MAVKKKSAKKKIAPVKKKDNRAVINISKDDYNWWIRALNRKEIYEVTGSPFVQGRGALVDADSQSHCCLGVLTERIKDKDAPITINGKDRTYVFSVRGLKCELKLTSKKYFNDESPSDLVFPSMAASEVMDELIDLNDMYDNSFKNIAKVIKKKLRPNLRMKSK